VSRAADQAGTDRDGTDVLPPLPAAPASTDPATDARAVERELILAEYGPLKAEQQARIAHRDGLTYTTIGAMVAVVAGTIQQHNVAVLLLLPPVAIALAWKYLANDEKISGAGRYIREQMAPRLTDITGVATVFGWESAHQGGVYSRVRPYVQVAVDLLTFCAPPGAALVAFWVLGPRPVGLLAVSVVEALLLTGLCWLVALASLGTSDNTAAPAPH
jgi:hypothetical protein